MAERIRTIKPEWRRDQKLQRAGLAARVLSVALITMADDQGRGEWREHLVALDVFGFEQDPSRILRESVARLSGWFLRVYEVRGELYFQILNWKSHQRVDKARPSIYPEPPEEPEPDGKGPENGDSRHVRESVATDSREPRDTLATSPESVAPGPGPWTRTLDPEPDRRGGAREPDGLPASDSAPDAGARSGGGKVISIQAGPLRHRPPVDLAEAHTWLRVRLDDAWMRLRACPLGGEHQAVQDSAAWIWRVVDGVPERFADLAGRLVARWISDPWIARNRVTNPAANFRSRLQALYDAEEAPPAPVDVEAELAAERAQLRERRMLALEIADHAARFAELDAITAAEEELRQRHRALEGRAS